MRARRSSLLVVLTVLLATVAGCGIDLDDEPRRISSENVPFDLLDPSTTTSSTTTTEVPAATTTTQIYLLAADGLLAAQNRSVPAPVRVRDAIAALLDGPTSLDSRLGLRSSIPTGTRLLGVDRDGGTAIIDLSEEFVGPVGDELKIAIAQLVYTATAVPGVTGVLVAIEGEIREVPDGEGRLTTDPLGRESFPQLDPAQAAPPQQPQAGGPGV